MNTNQKDVGWDFWVRWVLASLLGFAIGILLGGGAGAILGEGFASMAVLGAILGGVIGAMQRLVLRRHGLGSEEWVVATAIGYMVAGIVAETFFRRLPYSQAAIAVPVALLTVAGVAGAILQWMVLRLRVARAGWWLLVSLFGMAVSMSVGGPIFISLAKAGNTIGAVMVYVVQVGFGVGAIPGAGLVWLLRNPKIKPQDEMAMQGTR